jgi:hypothetical protein
MNFEQQNQSIRAVKDHGDVHPLRKKWWELCWWMEENNPFTKYIYVGSAQEYINLPRGQRTFMYLWYHHAIIRDGHRILGRKSERDAVETFLKYKFPVQYWLRENAFTVKVKISMLWDKLCYFVRPRQRWLTKQIPNEWNDKVTLIRDLNFAMIVHFIEDEKCFENTDYDNSSEGHAEFAKELRECYDYIKNERPKLDNLYWNSFPDENAYTGDYNVDYADINRIEKEMEDKDTKWLTWIITNRGYLWT